MTRTRRDVLAGGGTVLSLALGGCLSNRTGGSQTSSEPTSSTETPNATTTGSQTSPISPDPGWVKLNLIPTKPAEIVKRAVRSRSSFNSEGQQTLDRLASEGSVTVHNIIRYSELPLHPPYLVELGGSIYLINKRITASQEIEVHRFRIEVLEAAREDARAFADLSAVDQAIVKRGLSEEYIENGTPFMGTFIYKFETKSPTNSWIVTANGDVFVAYEDDTLRLQSKGTYTVVEQDVRYELTKVASNRSAAREYIVREYVQNISTENLPPAQREILTAAINRSEGYKEKGQGSKSFRALLDRLDEAPQVPNGGRYIRYNGTIYQVVQTSVEA